jgi:soluble lytic murein transglycosylase
MRLMIGSLLVLFGLVLAPPRASIMDTPALTGTVTSTGAVADVRAYLFAHMKETPAMKIELLSRLIVHLAREHHLSADLILAIIRVESGFDPLARSPAGAIGLMQLMPDTGEWLARRFGLRWHGAETLNSEEANIYLGVKYLSWLKDKYRNDLRMMLSAYNRGPAAVDEELENGQPVKLGYYRKITQASGVANVF